MCGVVGVYCVDEDLTSKVAYFTLYSLQHRGQESAGIAVANGGRIELYRGMGLVTEIFDESTLSKLRGKCAIGHVRYSTTGESKLENAQPILVKSKAGYLAVGHNGNLVNYPQLRAMLENEGRIFVTNSDTEVIAQLLSIYLMKYDVIEALELLQEKLIGSFSLTVLFNDVLIGYRDKLGFRPLCFGETEFGYVIASESCALDAIGANRVRDVKPGEAVIVRNGEVETFKLSESDRLARCVFEYIYFARPDSIIDGVSVYGARYRMGKNLAKESPVDADVVSPVPDSGTTAAIGFSEESGLKYLECLIKNRYVGRTFIMPEQRLRELSVQLKMNVVRENVLDKRIVLVDDSIVRGTTSRKIVDMVRRAKAREVHFRVGSPPIIAPCYFGIDMSTREELIASSKTVEEIRKSLNADSLAYLSLKGLLKAVGFDRCELCLACLTGRYPVPVPGETFEPLS